jgi:hypothetical protein
MENHGGGKHDADMTLRIHRDQPVIRIVGSLLGLGFMLIGALAILGAGEHASALSYDRAIGFGVTAVIVGIIAVLCSLLVKDLSNIWCQQPRRWR